ncbi:MAG TPA: apolipoprotein N-acyltransferase [Alphaproteobacteria bacterium]|nr:apolipoprotein N-acyltransferase [Rhodospirillaceae bacterium]HRJ13130.1 apolipoprotein N-acyltransferase [Alphaproteobacteria bacterium]
MLQRHPNLFLFLAGALAVAALPPINILPLIFLSLAFLILQIVNARNTRQAFARGFWWGLGYFAVGFYWINVALTVDWPRFAWLLPLCAIGLPAIVAIYSGLCSAAVFVTANYTRRPRLGIILLFPIFWTALEILRGHALSGFPWNVIGTAFTDFSALFQILSVVGIYGAGFIIALCAALCVAAFELPKHKFKYLGAAMVIIIAVAVFGAIRLQQDIPSEKILNVRIVQPNIPQDEKWDMASRQKNLGKLMALTAEPSNLVPDLVVWPEASVPYILSEVPEARMIIAEHLPRGAILAAGTIRRDAQTQQFFNSIEYMDVSSEILSHYDKFHLVPFGEYVPFGKYIPLPVVTAFSGLGRGAGPQTQIIAGVGISPLVCYEVIFPGEVVDVKNHPQLLLNVTNDGWYGNTIGPHQHLAQARARAVEEGIPLVRAANTGISVAVDRFGRIQKSLSYGTDGMIDAEVIITDTAPPLSAGGGFYLYLSVLIGIYAVFVIRMTLR